MIKLYFIQVTYDIESDPLRSQLSMLLKYYGLHRIQYSVFQGYLSQRENRQMVEEIESLSVSDEDSIQIIQLCKQCAQNIQLFGKQHETMEHLIF